MLALWFTPRALLLAGIVALALACASGFHLLATAAAALGVMLIAALVTDLLLGPRSRDVSVVRACEDHLRMRVDSTISYRIVNRSAVPITLGIVEAPARTLFYEPDEIAASVGPRGRTTAIRRVVPVARGPDLLGTLYIWHENPIGLLRRRFRIRQQQEIRVYPDLSAVERYGRLDVRNRIVEAGLRRIRMLGTGTEFESLREYLPGDAFRAINWKATARRGRLMVSQYEAERSQSVMLLVDCGRLMTPYVGDQRKLDYSVTAALSLASIASLASDRVGTVAFARDVIAARAPRSTAASLHEISEQLYDLEPRFEEADYARIFSFTGRQLRRRSLVVLLTDVVDPIAQKLVLAELRELARRHLVVCLFMSDAAIDDTVRREPRTVDDAFRLDVALGLAHDRKTAAANLERLGVIVVDAPARSLSIALIDEYLRIKQRGML
jgi:uncharacterized protein (DUF58 family)